jgi:serine/threonine protein kinase
MTAGGPFYESPNRPEHGCLTDASAFMGRNRRHQPTQQSRFRHQTSSLPSHVSRRARHRGFCGSWVQRQTLNLMAGYRGAKPKQISSLPYMAPEMIEHPKRAGRPADIWSVGAVLYRLVSEVFPFAVGFRAVNAITSGPPPRKPEILDSKPRSSPPFATVYGR